MKVLIPQDVADAGKEFLKEQGHEVVLGSAYDEETMIREVEGCDAILIRTAPLSRKVMEASKNLKVIAKHGVGVDNIDVAAATELGIQVTNGAISNMNSVAEHTVVLLTAIAHHVVEMDAYVKAGDWGSRNRVRLTEMQYKTVGIIGLGRIGRSVAQKLALGLDMKIIAYDAYVSKDSVPDYIEMKDSLEEIYKESDFVSLHCPATEETKGSVNMDCFKMMKETAFLINCARGEVVNEGDLYTALTTGEIRGAALDVMAEEPPSIDNKLMSLKNVILSPHCGAHSYESFDKMALHAAQGIDDVLSGKKPSWPVNKLN